MDKKVCWFDGKLFGENYSGISQAWRTDELYLKIRGNMKYLYATMDDETRFWIAHEVSDTKYSRCLTPLFAHAKPITGKRANILISDGVPNFHANMYSAILRAFSSEI